MRAVIYCRVSTKEQIDNYSLQTQELDCQRFCDREHLIVDRIFREEGESAKTSDRTQFQAMFAYCRKNRKHIDYVVVHRFDRFARNVKDHHAMAAVLRSYGVTLRSATEPTDQSAQGKLMEGLASVLAEFDNNARSDRTKDGMKAAMNAGQWPFKAPLGYLNEEDLTRQANLSPDPVRSELVKLAFTLVADESDSAAAALRKLNDLGFTTEKGKAVSAQTFNKMLRNPIYKGEIHSRTWGIRTAGRFMSLINGDLFDRTQAKLDGRAATSVLKSKINPLFPLRVFVRCGACGKPLTGSVAKKRYPYYFCRNAECRKLSIRTDRLERSFLALLERLQLRPQYKMLFQAVVQDQWTKAASQSQEMLTTARRNLTDARTRKDRLLDLLVDGKIAQADYERKAQGLQEQIEAAERAIASAEHDLIDVKGLAAYATEILSRTAVI